MRKTVIHILFLTMLLLVSCQQQGFRAPSSSENDSILNLSYINKVYNHDPSQALLLVDSAERQGIFPSWQADSLRAKMCLDGYYDLNRSIEYALRALNNDSVYSNDQRHLNMLVLVSQIEVSLGRYSECI